MRNRAAQTVIATSADQLLLLAAAPLALGTLLIIADLLLLIRP
jgi:hypothetical protein